MERNVYSNDNENNRCQLIKMKTINLHTKSISSLGTNWGRLSFTVSSLGSSGVSLFADGSTAKKKITQEPGLEISHFQILQLN